MCTSATALPVFGGRGGRRGKGARPGGFVLEGERPEASSWASTFRGGPSRAGVEAFYVKVLIVSIYPHVYLGMERGYRIGICVNGGLVE